MPKNYVGGLAGGSGALQAVYQRRVLTPVLLEAGALVIPGGGNFSASLLLELVPEAPAIPYLATGGGMAFGCGAGEEEDPETGEVRSSGGCNGTVFWAPRAGLAIAFGRVKLSLDGGIWYGHLWWTTNRVQPMVGLGAFGAL